MFKKFTEEDVKNALTGLLNENENATALDVKRVLRKNGFWAFQTDVAKTIRENYSNWGLVKYDNGIFNTYSYPSPDEIEDEVNDEPDSIVGDNYSSLPYTMSGNSSTGSTLNFGFLSKKSTTPTASRSKIVKEPVMLDDDMYQLTIEHNGKKIKLVVSNSNTLTTVGTLVYEVRTPNSNWYLYSEDKNFITRHKAIYYVWKVISQEYDGFLAYADIRSTKMF